MDLPATLPKPLDENAAVAAAVAAAKSAPAQEAPKSEQKTETTPAPKQETTKEQKTDASPKPILDDEDELKADENGMLPAMTMKSFMRRVSSMTRANLRKQFGTDDVSQIIEERKELEKLRAEKAEAEKQKLTEVERLKVEKQEAEKRALDAEERANEREQRSVAREVDVTLKSHAKTLVDREYVDVLLMKVAKAAAKDDNISTPRQAQKWMNAYVAKHPKLARAKADAPKAAEEQKAKEAEETKPPRKVPITNGARNVGKPTPAGSQDSPILGKMTRDDIFKQTGLKL